MSGIYIKGLELPEEGWLGLVLYADGGVREFLQPNKEYHAIPAADVVERPRWTPVTERLPENCADVLAYIERNAWGDGDVPHRKREIAIGYHVNGLWHVDGCSGVDCIAWMQLPEAPKEVLSGTKE